MATASAVKYLYGKEKHLKNLYSGDGVIRFTDIVKYGRLENSAMRDDETLKYFKLDPRSCAVSLNGKALDASSFTESHDIYVQTPRAFCLCLSHKRCDPVLFDRFEADICVEIDVNELVAALRRDFSVWPGAKIVANDVKYYPPMMNMADLDLGGVIFYKPDKFQIEAEYRVAIHLPESDYFNCQMDYSQKLFSNEAGKEQYIYMRGGAEIYVGNVHKLSQCLPLSAGAA